VTADCNATANIFLPLNKKSPHYEIKKALMLNSPLIKDFDLGLNDTHNSVNWRLMINYARFLTYKGEPVVLTNANN